MSSAPKKWKKIFIHSKTHLQPIWAKTDLHVYHAVVVSRFREVLRIWLSQGFLLIRKLGLRKRLATESVNDNITSHWQRDSTTGMIPLACEVICFVKLNAEKSILLQEESLGGRAKTNYRNRECLRAQIMKKLSTLDHAHRAKNIANRSGNQSEIHLRRH